MQKLAEKFCLKKYKKKFSLGFLVQKLAGKLFFCINQIILDSILFFLEFSPKVPRPLVGTYVPISRGKKNIVLCVKAKIMYPE